ncbi:pyridoxal phosphate-dependent aminotransferase [Kineococcus sp. SYSU DK003]|uniref:pyridoxal phosphate-dependent aminotransferase n=1 Tax=Kineococcus sp. SYSU DK003 TaxID=3383124 RepID=UPI003D7DC193
MTPTTTTAVNSAATTGADGTSGTGLDVHAHSASFFDVSRRFGRQRPVVDFCIPTNSYFPTPEVFERLRADLPTLLKYYPDDSSGTSRELARLLGLNPQTVAMANGSTELITWIDHLLVEESLAVPVPTFGRWTDQPLETGKRVDMFPLREETGFTLDVDAYVAFVRERGSRVAVVCQPNNPDGGYVHRERIVRMLDEFADLDLVVVDESFLDFVDAEPECSVVREAALRPNVIVLRSLGKNFGLHGVRFGYMVANPALTERVSRALPKWNLNSLAEAVVGLLSDHLGEYRASLRRTAADRDDMVQRLQQVPGLTVFPTTANFVLVKVPPGCDGRALRDHLVQQHGVYVRDCGNKLGLTSDFLRLVVRPAQDVDRLLDGLRDHLGARSATTA